MTTARAVSIPVLLATIVSVVGCSGGGQASPAARTAPAAATSRETAKRIVAAAVAEPSALRSQLSRSSAGSLPGTREMEQLVHAGLTIADDQGRLVPELAEAVPSVENGLWKVFPDGGMETTWKIRTGARWQDGQPVTADDLVFTAQVARDPDLLLFRDLAFDAVDSVKATDSQTVVVTWSKPWIEADSLFGAFRAVPPLPLPKHILATPYTENKAGFTDLPFWTTEFVGAGPYRLKDWEQGSSLSLTRFDDFVLGKPKVDEIEVRFIQDTSALVSNVLAGEVELPIGINLSFEDASQIKDQWHDGSVKFTPSNSIKIWPQFRNPTPAIIGDVRFRRALLHGLDRKEMADSLMAGQTSVSDSTLLPTEPEYTSLKSSIVSYGFDPRQAMDTITELGYAKGSDDVWRDASGQRLSIEVRTIQRDILVKSILSATDFWKKIGLDANPVVLTAQQRADRAFYAMYPSFDTSASSNGVDDFISFHGSQAKTAENHYTGSNRTGYTNPAMDALIDQFFTTIPTNDRLQVAGKIVHQLTDQVVFFPLFYELSPTVVSNRLRNVPTQVAGGFTLTWNAYQWDTK